MRRVALIGIWVLAVVFALRFLGVSYHGPPPKPTIEIGGDMSIEPSFDIAVRDGADLAILQARSVRGFPLRFVPYDDSAQGAYSADRGAQNIDDMTRHPGMLAMVGPLRGPVAKAVIPIANRAMFAMISPTITEPCLTRPLGQCSLFGGGADLAATLRPAGKNNYFHLAATDEFHEPVMADFAYRTLGLRRIAVVDAGWPYAMLISESFALAFIKDGGDVVASLSVDDSPGPAARDFRPWLRQAKAAGAEAIYAGGLAFSGIDQLDPRLQSQGIFDPSSYYFGIDGFPDLAHRISDWSRPSDNPMINDHVYATLTIGAPYLNPRAAGTIAAFIKLHPDPVENNSQAFAGYDSANILIAAIGRAIDANGGKLPSRRQVVVQLAKTKNFHGLTGTYTFTPDGDPTMPTLEIEQYRNGAWTPMTNITVANQ